MTKEQYLQLKDELKQLAKNIREAKNSRRTACQKFSGFQNYHNFSFSDYYEGRVAESTWLPLREDYYKLYHLQNIAILDVEKLKREYRLKHIAYCFSRGRTLSEIEPHTREGNEVDIHTLRPILKKYDIPFPQSKKTA